jgi:hypothetical protein
MMTKNSVTFGKICCSIPFKDKGKWQNNFGDQVTTTSLVTIFWVIIHKKDFMDIKSDLNYM